MSFNDSEGMAQDVAVQEDKPSGACCATVILVSFSPVCGSVMGVLFAELF